MSQYPCIVILAALLPRAAFAQPETQPVFDIADVHVSPKTLHPAKRTSFRAGRFELDMATMTDLIAAAWGVEHNYVFGSPGWLDLDRFGVIARAPADISPQALKLMLQSLLAQQFQLAIHMDQKPMPAYVLSTGAASRTCRNRIPGHRDASANRSLPRPDRSRPSVVA